MTVARPPPAQPVARRRILQQRVGHRGQLVRHLPVDEPHRPPPRPLARQRRPPRLGHVGGIADRDRRGGRQGRVAGPGAVRIEDVREQVQVDPIAERAPEAGGHLVAHVREQLVRRLSRPPVQEVHPAQRRRFRPVQPRPVALPALPRIHRPPGGGLLGREGPVRRRGLRRRFDDIGRGQATRHEQRGGRHPDRRYREIRSQEPVAKSLPHATGDASRLALLLGHTRPGTLPRRGARPGRLAGFGATRGSTTGSSPTRFADSDPGSLEHGRNSSITVRRRLRTARPPSYHQHACGAGAPRRRPRAASLRQGECPD